MNHINKHLIITSIIMLLICGTASAAYYEYDDAPWATYTTYTVESTEQGLNGDDLYASDANVGAHVNLTIEITEAGNYDFEHRNNRRGDTFKWWLDDVYKGQFVETDSYVAHQWINDTIATSVYLSVGNHTMNLTWVTATGHASNVIDGMNVIQSPPTDIPYNSTPNSDLYTALYYEDTFDDAHGIADNHNLSLENQEYSYYIQRNTGDGWLLTKKIRPKSEICNDALGTWGVLHINKHDIQNGVWSWSQANENSLKVTVCDGETNASISGFVDLTGRNIDLSGISTSTHPTLRLNFSFTSDNEVLKDFRIDWSQTSQSNFEGIPRWWNNHTFASALSCEDWGHGSEQAYINAWNAANHVQPMTTVFYAGIDAAAAEAALPSTWEIGDTSYGVSDTNTYSFTTYSSLYSWLYETRTDIEAAVTNHSRWGQTCLVFSTPGHARQDWSFEAIYDAGFRGHMNNPASGETGNYTYTWDVGLSPTRYYNTPSTHERYNSSRDAMLPQNKYDWLALAASQQNRGTAQQTSDSINESAANHSLSFSWVHPWASDEYNWGLLFCTEIEKHDDVWLATSGEIESYHYWKDHIVISHNSSASNATCEIYDVKIYKNNDSRYWDVPITLDFSSISDFENVSIHYLENGTLYKSLDNISTSGTDHRLMQEGYTLSGTDLYVSTLLSDKQIKIYSTAGTNDIDLTANKYGMLRKDVDAAQTFSTIADGFAHDVCFTWWDDVTDTWLSYWVGDTYNSGQSIPEHESYFVLMDGTGETVSCGIAPAETVVIPTGWSSIYLRESTNHTLTEVKTGMQSDGTVTNLYAWNHEASGTGAWVSVDVTPSFVVEPNEGLLINNGGAQYNWDGSI